MATPPWHSDRMNVPDHFQASGVKKAMRTALTDHTGRDSAHAQDVHIHGAAARFARRSRRKRSLWSRASTFEKVIIANSAIISLDTAAGWWITQHDPETYHYLIDTAFIVAALLIALAINFAFLRAAFAPLHNVFATIRAVEAGNLDARVRAPDHDADAVALARAFNSMLDRLAFLHNETAVRVLRAQEDERRRLALELHDQTGQSLTALALHAETIARRLEHEHTDAALLARAQAEHLGVLAQKTLAEVQALSRQLRPPLLDDVGLAAAIRWLASDSSERLHTSIRVRVRGVASEDVSSAPAKAPDERGGLALLAPEHPDAMTAAVPPGEQRLPADVETALFRVAQEAITNAVRHGQATRVQVALRRRAEDVMLTVADDGMGFDPPSRAIGPHERQARWGLGLEGMRERVRTLSGSLIIRSQPGRGCAVRAVIPLHLPPGA